jgi:ribosomal protein S18 acetylase RimI-like enzyme
VIDPDVRPAAPADADQLWFLEAEARQLLHGQRGGERWLETHPERAEAWAAAIDHTVVAHIDEVVVGYLVTSIAGELATIDEVYVTPEAREVGFGDALLAAAMERARAAGATLLEGEALPGDRDTKNLYERAEIKARLITVSAPL